MKTTTTLLLAISLATAMGAGFIAGALSVPVSTGAAKDAAIAELEGKTLELADCLADMLELDDMRLATIAELGETITLTEDLCRVREERIVVLENLCNLRGERIEDLKEYVDSKNVTIDRLKEICDDNLAMLNDLIGK